MKIKLTYFFIGLFFTVGCSSQDEDSGFSEWSIPTNEIFDGGPGRDGIPALTSPEMVNVSQASYLQDNDLVAGVVFDNEARAYPHIILDWHEIINDQINDNSYAIVYCPLTGTGSTWDRNIGGNLTTFGVSGLLYNTNIIPFDRITGSNWSQMRGDCVNGPLLGTKVDFLPVLETTWGTWKEMYPDSKVASTNTGIGRPYGTYPYINGNGQDYRVDPFLIFPIDREDNRLPRKERVLGVKIDNEVKAFKFNDFEDGIEVMNETLAGQNFVVAGSNEHQLLVAYGNTLSDDTALVFEAIQDELPIVMQDQLGNKWDALGRAVSGPNSGEQLDVLESYIGYWFAWATFNPGLEIAEY